MPIDIVMPMFSETMEAGTIVKWLKQVGDAVSVGDDLVEIETEKATMTYQSDAGGVLLEVVAGEGATLPVGTLIARIANPSESRPVSNTEGDGVLSRGGGESGPINASPVVRRMALERGINLSRIQGSGPGGRITRSDLNRSLGGPAQGEAATIGAPAHPSERLRAARGEAEVIELTKVQQAVARRMAEAKASVPHFYITVEVDVTRILERRAELKALESRAGIVPSFNDFVVKATAMALREDPRANSAYREGHVERYSRINVGIAVTADVGLLAPTIFDADRKSITEITTISRDLVKKVRDGSISETELSGGTFTISNLGMHGVEAFAAVINPPQSAILAVGRPVRRPVVDGGGQIVVRDLVALTLSCDHRALSGVEGAALLVRLRELLEEPSLIAAG